jgi:hypothetical protein
MVAAAIAALGWLVLLAIHSIAAIVVLLAFTAWWDRHKRLASIQRRQ